jgi:hypothetical protein
MSQRILRARFAAVVFLISNMLAPGASVSAQAVPETLTAADRGIDGVLQQVIAWRRDIPIPDAKTPWA